MFKEFAIVGRATLGSSFPKRFSLSRLSAQTVERPHSAVLPSTTKIGLTFNRSGPSSRCRPVYEWAGREIIGHHLVSRNHYIAGYNDFSLIRAFSVVKRQSMDFV
ncbi:MAG: hypothetical protein OXC17_14740, partial [Aestuariivita sp.]|nr:hypothetical protein [Aestuariivita sp.]